MEVKSLTTSQIYPWTQGKKIGEGTYGTVYIYNTPDPLENVAIKLSKREHSYHSVAFIREAAILMALWSSKQNYTVQLLDVVLIDNKIGLVFPLAEGSLSDYLTTNKGK